MVSHRNLMRRKIILQ